MIDREQLVKLASLLPDKLSVTTYRPYGGTQVEKSIKWRVTLGGMVRDEVNWELEGLRVCQLIEQDLDEREREEYLKAMYERWWNAVPRDMDKDFFFVTMPFTMKAGCLLEATRDRILVTDERKPFTRETHELLKRRVAEKKK